MKYDGRVAANAVDSNALHAEVNYLVAGIQ
jgi:hypothetical protein